MNKRLVYIVGGTVAGITLAYVVYDIIKRRRNRNIGNRFTPKDEEVTTSASTTIIEDQLDIVPSDGAKESKYADSQSLEIGDKGQRVFILQSALNQLGAGLIVDGKFGQATYNAFNEFADEWWSCGLTYWCNVSYEEYQNTLKKAEAFGWNRDQIKLQSKLYWTS